jgi:hypothetical protein
MLIQKTARQRVAGGAAFLDDHVAGWREVANPATLNLASCRDCVLAQLHRGGLLGRQLFDFDAFHNASSSLGLTERRAIELGFLVPNGGFSTFTEYAMLTGAWRDELTGRVPTLVPDPVPAPIAVLDAIERTATVDWPRLARAYTVTNISFRSEPVNLTGILTSIGVAR